MVSEPVQLAPPPPLQLVSEESAVNLSRDQSVVSLGQVGASSAGGSAAPQFPAISNVFAWAGGPLAGLDTTPTYTGPQPRFPPQQLPWHLGQGQSQGQYQQYPPQYQQYPPLPSTLPAAAGGPPAPPVPVGGQPNQDISLMFQTLAVTQTAQESYIRQLQAREQETLANQAVFKKKFKEEMRAADLLHDTEKV